MCACDSFGLLAVVALWHVAIVGVCKEEADLELDKQPEDKHREYVQEHAPQPELAVSSRRLKAPSCLCLI